MICSVTIPFPHCGKQAIAKGWCPAHYRRASQNNGDPLPNVPLQPRRPSSQVAPCSVVTCDGPAEYASAGLCRPHYEVARNHDGNPLWVPINESAAYFRRMLAKPSTGCRFWPYSVDGGGYGIVSLDGKRGRVHSLACEFRWGPKPEAGLVARHGPCRTPSCWAWEHLTWGTPGDNFHDRWRDGTEPVGMQNGRAKLTDDQVREIRTLRAEHGILQRELAAQFNVSKSLIAMILREEIWTHLL